jgi:5S rRNA maturation endonuclease (ribonuclease M5)
VNVPLAKSDNERARGLVELNHKFVVDPAAMPPAASAYFRRRPFLTCEVCQKWRMGYLPRSAGEDRTGGTMRGMVVYPFLSEAGEVLTWFGRDPSFEEKHQQWEQAGKQGRAPEKFHFVKGFHRGLELFGQHASRTKEPGYRDVMRNLGLIVVEGPNDVIALDALGVPAVGLCSNVVAKQQAAKLVQFAKLISRGRLTLMLDCDPAGEAGAKDALWQLATHCDVRLAWNGTTHDGRFRGRQPESLSAEEWAVIRASL